MSTTQPERLAVLRAEYIHDCYGIPAEAHGARVVIRKSDRQHLISAMVHDYQVVFAPDWTFDPARVAWLRVLAVMIVEWRRVCKRWGLGR